MYGPHASILHAYRYFLYTLSITTQGPFHTCACPLSIFEGLLALHALRACFWGMPEKKREELNWSSLVFLAYPFFLSGGRAQAPLPVLCTTMEKFDPTFLPSQTTSQKWSV
jgi:hypothetical protein